MLSASPLTLVIAAPYCLRFKTPMVSPTTATKANMGKMKAAYDAHKEKAAAKKKAAKGQKGKKRKAGQ